MALLIILLSLFTFLLFNLSNGKCCVASFLKLGVAHLAVERLGGGVCFHSLVAASLIVPLRGTLGPLGLQPIVKTKQKTALSENLFYGPILLMKQANPKLIYFKPSVFYLSGTCIVGCCLPKL